MLRNKCDIDHATIMYYYMHNNYVHAQVGAEIAQLEQDLEQRQKREVEGHRKKGTDGDVSIHQGVADLSLVSEEAGAKPESSQEGKKSRAQKRKVQSSLVHWYYMRHSIAMLNNLWMFVDNYTCASRYCTCTHDQTLRQHIKL